nr:unnamed protein product [Digitaria exilis]
MLRSEFKANHAEWVSTVKPNLGPGIRERVYEAITSEDGPMEDFHALRTEFKSALADLVKLSIPLGMRDGVPVSVSLVARHGADRFLLNVAQDLYEMLKEETKKAWCSSNSSL